MSTLVAGGWSLVSQRFELHSCSWREHFIIAATINPQHWTADCTRLGYNCSSFMSESSWKGHFSIGRRLWLQYCIPIFVCWNIKYAQYKASLSLDQFCGNDSLKKNLCHAKFWNQYLISFEFRGADSNCGYDWWEFESISVFSGIIKFHSGESRFNWIKCERTFSNVFACRIQCRYKKSISQLDRKLLVWRLMSGNVNKKSAVYDKKTIDIVSSGKSQDHYRLTPLWLADLLSH